MIPPATLETERLRLRPPTRADAGFLFEGYASDAEVTRYLNWDAHRDVSETERFLERCEEVWRTGSAFPWLIVRRRDGEPLGMIELRVAGARADCGYVLARRHWGNGYATEAVIALRDWVLSQPEIHRFWAVCDIANRASMRVLEKAGLACEGVLRRWDAHPGAGEEPRDCVCYAAVRESGPPRTRFAGVHPVIPVSDLEEAVRFYEGKLGFAKVFDEANGAGPPDHVGMYRGGVCLHLRATPAGERVAAPLVRIRVVEIDPLHDEYAAKGLVGDGGRLHDTTWGSREFTVRGPDGASLVFYEDL